MSKRIFPLVVILVAAPLSANDAEDSAQLASEFVSAVNEGRSLNPFSFNPSLSTMETMAISELAGCSPTIAEGSRAEWVALDWRCPSNPQAERQTALYFSRDGTVSVWVNPVEEKLEPNMPAIEAVDLPGHRSLTKRFAEAVKRGADPTLGGLIPIAPEHLAKLYEVRGFDYRSTSGNSKASQSMFWGKGSGPNSYVLTTDLRFDNEGRPIGLFLSPVGRKKSVGRIQ